MTENEPAIVFMKWQHYQIPLNPLFIRAHTVQSLAYTRRIYFVTLQNKKQ